MKFLRKLVVLTQYMFWALSRINRPHLGDIIKLKDNGKVGFLTQGVSDPYWNLITDSQRLTNIHKSKFKLEQPVKGRIDRFKQSYQFQKSNWFLIDTNNRKLFSRISYRS